MIRQKLFVIAVGVLNQLVSLTAPFVVPFALIFTPRSAKSLAWGWYDTPDEPELYDLNEEGVKKIHDKFGHLITAWYWFGLRNRAHGFASVFARSWPRDHVDPGGVGDFLVDGLFVSRRQWGFVQGIFGWQAYRSVKFPTGFEVRPVLSIKFRRNVSS